MKHLFSLFLVNLMICCAFGQNTGVVQGTVRAKNSQEVLIGVTILAEGTQTGTATDTEGNFKLVLPTGSYNLKASFIGYQSLTQYNVVVTSGNANQVTFELEEEVSTLNEVEVVSTRAVSPTTIESPLSIQRLTVEEIKSNPGGNFDISRVIQSLPGVGGTTGGGGFRNDIIIRGGAPNENVYYLDGIEIPVINHFSTQGSAGGPVGILNVSFIEDVKLSSSAFEARYDNTLASVFQFKQKEGNRERVQGNVRLSSTELATTLEGPIGKKTTFLASARRSYLQFLFQAIDLPIRPNYWDFQYKVTHKLNAKTTITTLGVGAIDEFNFGIPRKSTPDKEYILGSLPAIDQWNYTIGVSVKRLLKNGYMNLALSRNMFDNSLNRFEYKQEGNEDFRILRVRSQEIENKFRLDVNKSAGQWRYSYGFSGQYVKFNNNVFNRLFKEIRDGNGNLVQPQVNIEFNTALEFFRYGAFVQTSRSFFKNRLGLSAGLRTDMNSFTTSGQNPIETLSPRVSLSWIMTERWNLNASVGRYFKLPIYTVLGFRDENGVFANKNNRYIQSTHYVAGLEYLPKTSLRFTLEGFYKDYDNYPVSVRDGISLANQGGEFGAIGNEKVSSTGNGRAYGIEFLAQQKLTSNIYGVFSYTFVRSEFSGADGKLLPSAWDNRHLISALFGKKFKRGWEIGMKYRFAGGSPYTPFDEEASRRNFATFGTGRLDYSRLNSLRLRAFNQFDFRVDKKWNFRRLTLDLYLDVTNAFVSKNPSYPQYSFKRLADNSAFETTDGAPLRADGSNGIPVLINNEDAIATPTIGFIIEF